MRYLVAALVATVAALLILGVLRNPMLRRDNVEIPADELLAYDLSATAGVTMDLLEQTSELRITSWCVVPRTTPEERFDYSIRVNWQTATGSSLGEDLLAFESRVSEAASNTNASSFATRLAYSNVPVTDSRTVQLSVPELSGQRPTRMRLVVGTVGPARVLVRATFPEQRRALEIAALDRRLTPLERRELIRDRASVGYDDLPFSLRRVALATWQRRLDAHGQEGIDYRVERLLIGTGRTNVGLAAAERRAWPIDRSHALALNIRRPVELHLSAPAHSVLQITPEVALKPKSITLDGSGHARVRVGASLGPQTVAISTASQTSLPVSASVPTDELDAIIGSTQVSEDSHYQSVSPMLRRFAYYQLDPQRPVSVNVGVGQKFLGVTVRGTHSNPHGHIAAEIDREQASIDVDLVPSLFEQWSDATPATDGQQLYLRIAPGASKISLRGSSQLRIAPFTADPEVTNEHLALEYAEPLNPANRWMFPRYDVDRMVALRPENELELLEGQRKLELIAQSRIVALDTSGSRPELALVPASPTVQRHVIEPLRWGPGIALPEDVVIALDHPRRGYIVSNGPRAGRAKILYRLEPRAVGDSLAFEVDQAVLHREDIVANSGQFELPIAPGTHQFGIGSRWNDAQILLEATPVEAAGALRRKVVHRIAPRALLRFVFDKAADIERVIVTCYLQQQHLVTLRYAIYGAEQKDFLHSVTATRGELSGIAVEARGTWYWEIGPERRVNQYRQTIVLGNDLRPGKMALVLRNQNTVPVFVSLVLVGQDNQSQRALQRFWTTEEP